MPMKLKQLFNEMRVTLLSKVIVLVLLFILLTCGAITLLALQREKKVG